MARNPNGNPNGNFGVNWSGHSGVDSNVHGVDAGWCRSHSAQKSVPKEEQLTPLLRSVEFLRSLSDALSHAGEDDAVQRQNRKPVEAPT